MDGKSHRVIGGICAVLLLFSAAAPPVLADRASDRLEGFREEADAQIERALAYLAKAQDPEGAFPGEHGKTNGAVGLCAMAFLAHGYTPGKGPYGQHIDRCLDYIISGAAENGYMGTRGGRMYSHCIGTLLLAEVSGMVDARRQRKIDEVFPKAIAVILEAQSVKKYNGNFVGGWRYTPPDTTSDVSVSGWAIMALRSARLNGAPVPEKSIRDGIAFILRCQAGGAFRYTIWQGAVGWPHVGSTGAAVLCLELTGQHHHPASKAVHAYLRDAVKRGDFGKHRFYGIYYITQAMFQMGDPYWEEYALMFYPRMLASQREDGSYGTPYQTAMTTLGLGVTCRQLPIYQR